MAHAIEGTKSMHSLRHAFSISGQELVRGTNCPPHETIEFWIAFTNLFEVICRIFTIRQYCNNVINTEISVAKRLGAQERDINLFSQRFISE